MHANRHTDEIPVLFECQGERLIGIIHHADSTATVGVLVVVGGPQYRVGSHRQFVLLARHLAAQGVSTMRFDVRGMGDAEGGARGFQQLDDDIQAAIDCFFAASPRLKQVVIWGLCDAASAALLYAYQDERVQGLVLLNPWVYTEKGAAKTYLKHYYLRRLVSPDLWRKIFSLKFDYLHSLAALAALFKRLAVDAPGIEQDAELDLPGLMKQGLRRFKYPVLLILSGRDLTADEFKETVKSDSGWQGLLKDHRITRYDLVEADHTFSSGVWRDQVAAWTLSWVKSKQA